MFDSRSAGTLAEAVIICRVHTQLIVLSTEGVFTQYFEVGVQLMRSSWDIMDVIRMARASPREKHVRLPHEFQFCVLLVQLLCAYHK
jgi:hypothetical protein